MSTPGYGQNASVVGPEVVPTTAAASGIWSLAEVSESVRDGLWPKPFTGWFASWNPGIYTDTATGDKVSAGKLSLDSSDNIYISCTQYDTSASMACPAIAKVQSNGNGLVNNNKFEVGSSGTGYWTRLSNLTAAGTNLYISGDTTAFSGYTAWRAKLDSSYALQWFGDNGTSPAAGDGQQFLSGYDSYGSTNMGLKVAPNESYAIHVFYGYHNSWGGYAAYLPLMMPVDPATGNNLNQGSGNYYPVMIYGNPPNMGSYPTGVGINNERFAYVNRDYHSSYGGYQNQYGEDSNQFYNGWSSMQSARLAPVGSGGSFGGVYANSPKIGPYRATGTPGAYYWNGIFDVVGGTYAGNAYISKWDPYTGGYSGWSLGYRYAVNAADSPATPTQFDCASPPINDSTDTHCYFIVRDNGNTPSQSYLIKHDIANQTNIWQRKILVYRTADGSGVANQAYFRSLEIDSTDEHVYGIATLTTNSVDRNECIVFKLPTDGAGSATYTVGDYTIVYGASTATGTAGDILAFNTGALGQNYTSFANTGTATTALTQPTETWTKG